MAVCSDERRMAHIALDEQTPESVFYLILAYAGSRVNELPAVDAVTSVLSFKGVDGEGGRFIKYIFHLIFTGPYQIEPHLPA